MKGTIKSLVVAKNFGFIAPEDGAKDIFFHASALSEGEFGDLRIGDTVSFETEESEKGPRAKNLTVVR